MALPSSGVITAAMINAELNRSASTPFSLNDSAVRALAGKPSGAIAFSDLRGKSSEIVKYITSSGSGPDVLSALFTSAEWSSDALKRVVVNAGVEIGGNGYGYAIAVAPNAGGQAGSFAGELILENRGVISGRGGAAGSDGLTALFANLLGRAGNKMQVNNIGTIRGGGGGGGRGGNGGQGGAGGFNSNVNVLDPSNGTTLYSFDTKNPFYGSNNYVWINSRGWPNETQARWGYTFNNGGIITGATYGATSVTYEGWTYVRGELAATYSAYDAFGGGPYTYDAYRVRRYRTETVWNNTVGGAGGAGANGGVGQGYGQAAAGGGTGANGSGGGTNAGTGGKGGNGGSGGAYGAAGGTGVAGATGAAGNNGGGSAGAAGAGGGAAGCYIDGASRVTWIANGTRQGRAIN